MSTIKGKSVFVEVEDGKTIEVRRMSWKSMRNFLRQLGAIIAKVYVGASADQTAGALIFSKLPEIIAGSDELVVTLCTGSTNLTLDQFNDLDALTATKVLAESIAINCDDEIKNSWAGIAASVAGLMPQRGLMQKAESPTTM